MGSLTPKNPQHE